MFISGSFFLHRDGGFDARMRIVIFDGNIFVAERENVFHVGIELQGRERARLTGKLAGDLLEVIAVNVRIAERVDEIADSEPADLRDHVREKRVARDIERHAEEQIRAALIKLTTQLSVPADVKLKQRVTRRERHFVGFAGIPAGNDEAARRGIALDFGDEIGDLVNAVARERAVGVFCRAEVAPLVSVNRTEVAFLASEACALLGSAPFVPNRDAAFPQPRIVCVSADEPKQFLNNGTRVDFFRRNEREAFRQIETHLRAENPARSHAGAVSTVFAVFENVSKKV